VNGRDVFIALPTGFGKSVCYGCLPVAYDILSSKKNSIVIVVSSLATIMKDQVSTYTSKGILRHLQYQSRSKDRRRGRPISARILQPGTTLGKKFWRSMLRTDIYWDNLVAFAVDEAHCVKKW